jgi:hypothetical protein
LKFVHVSPSLRDVFIHEARGKTECCFLLGSSHCC